MKFIIYLFFFLLFLNFNNISVSKNLFDSDFNKIEIKTTNADKTKRESIEMIKKQNLISIIDKILDKKNKKKFLLKLKDNNFIHEIIQNIIIENEVITNEKYIAEIKINFDRKKIIEILRKNKINYSDSISEPYLILSTYDYDFINTGLEIDNLFYNSFKENNNFQSHLLKYNFPELDTNDRYILPYKKMINEDHEAFRKILEKYNNDKAFYVKIKKIDSINFYIEIKSFDKIKNEFFKIGEIDFFYDNKINNLDIKYSLLNKISFFLDDWWKNEVLINNSKLSTIECLISSKNFDDLNYIKLKIRNLSQVKNIKSAKIKINNNIELIDYYGNIKILSENLSSQGIILNNYDNCTISSNL